MGPSDPVLTATDLHKRYGDVEALQGVSLSVDRGDFHCLVGPNGSGKTTLLRLALGLTRPTDGQLERADVTVGCGFQRPNFYPALTVAENLDVFGSLVGADDDWRERVLSELRLEPARSRTAGALSGGFARKLDLALALLKRPDLLLLDEPLGDLDDVSADRLLSFLADYRDAGNTLLVSTHHLRSFEPHLDRLTVMHEGGVVADRRRADLSLDGPTSLHDQYVRTVRERERRAESNGAGDSDHPPDAGGGDGA